MEDKVIIGSHNTMSYLTPSKWYTRLFKCFSRCQKLPLSKQLEIVDCVDLRVFRYNNQWRFAHGLAEYTYGCCITTIYSVLETIKFHKPNCIIRILLEKVKDKDKEFDEFKSLCKTIEVLYPNFIFICGRYKKDWSLIYQFKNNVDLKINQFVSSMENDVRWYEKFIPILYAKRMNKINKYNTNKGINLFDFVELDLNIKKDG